MSKVGKRRPCPVVGHDISAAECGENRNRKYRCPAECNSNPFAPQNYQTLLQLEEEVHPIALERMLKESPDHNELQRARQRASRDSSQHALDTFFHWHMFFKRDAAGLSWAQRWERAGFPGLNKNDQQNLFRAMLQLRVVLLEAHRILDGERSEAADLLATTNTPLLVVDRSFAAKAVRFGTYLCWAYPLPHFWRLSGSAIMLPSMGPFEPVEVLHEIVRHLGGPNTEVELRFWLAEHLPRFDEALGATQAARTQQMLQHLDAQYGKAVYELQAPLAQCRAALDGNPDIQEDSPTSEETAEGFSEVRVWFTENALESRALPRGARPILGRVLLGQSVWRLEAFGAAHLAKLRELFEQRLGNRVRFAGERRDNLAARMLQKEAPVSPALVPPRLLEEPDEVVMASSLLPEPPSGQSAAQAEVELQVANHRSFLEDHIGALDNHTPREAARDPALRPKLLHLLKDRVRTQDEANLRTGGNVDINWLLRELGTAEILFDPPPPRPPLDLAGEAEPPEEELEGYPEQPAPPPLPDRPLTLQEVQVRVRAAMAAFETAQEAVAKLGPVSTSLFLDLREMSQDLLADRDFNFLLIFLLQARFALIPPGFEVSAVDYDELFETVSDALQGLDECLTQPDPANLLQKLLQGRRQPALIQFLIGEMLSVADEGPKNARPGPDSPPAMMALLIGVIESLDRALPHRAAAPSA